MFSGDFQEGNVMSEETKFECPNCHSDNIQSFEVAYRNGVTTSSSTTTGLGVGSGGGLGLGTRCGQHFTI